MNVEIGTEAAQLLFCEYIKGIFVAVCLSVGTVGAVYLVPANNIRLVLHSRTKRMTNCLFLRF
jgi:hypothetical protein